MSTVLQIDGLSKSYGKLKAVDNLTLSITHGTVFGLLGPNGSGKTTTLGMLLDVIRPTSGEFTWFGQAPTQEQRKRIGAILEKPNFLTKMSARKNLVLVCKIKEVPTSRIDEVLLQVGLLERADDPFRTYSLGMKQRLAIASALLPEPEVLILDEPTNGLDPQGIAEIRELISSIAQSGKTIILASHLLDEVEKVCSEYAILKKGKLIHQGRVDAKSTETKTLAIASIDMAQLERSIIGYAGYISHTSKENLLQVICAAHSDSTQLNRYLAEQGIYLSLLTEVGHGLEEQFLDIVARS